MSEKYPQIVLHVGMHKTGTTSIQNNCHRHREFLRGFGIVYPSFNYKGIVRANHSGPVTTMVCESADRYGAQWRFGLGDDTRALQLDYQRQLTDILEHPQGDTLILSGETISVFAIEHLQSLRELLLQHTDNLRVIVYIRNPLSAVGSAVQQRVRGGVVGSIKAIAGIVRRRYERLSKVFPESLEVINFHDAIAHEAGLVGSFLENCGLPRNKADELEFIAVNQRISMEAFKIMLAINKQYPAKLKGPAGREREYTDLQPLSFLPGERFRLENLDNSEGFQELTEEARWLEQQLGFKFPALADVEARPLWGQVVLFALEDAIRQLEHEHHRAAAADFLQQEAASLQSSDPDTSAVLAFIAARLHTIESDPVPFILQRLGADYFRNGAMQVENYSPELALELMSLAQRLRPAGVTINKSIDNYRKKLGK